MTSKHGSNVVLKIGSLGEGVEELHQLLIETGLDVGIDAADHIFGKDTHAAVLRFQVEHFGPQGAPLDIDGVVGGDTWWSLEHPSAEPLAVADDAPADIVTGELAGVALEAALGELRARVHEEPPGSNRSSRIDLYTNMVDKPPRQKGPPWCAFFVSWCFAQNRKGSPFGRIGGALNIGHWAERNNCAIAATLPPLAGDIFVINRDGVHGHTGLIRSVRGDQIHTVEGNSANAVRSILRPIRSVQTFVRIRP